VPRTENRLFLFDKEIKMRIIKCWRLNRIVDKNMCLLARFSSYAEANKAYEEVEENEEAKQYNVPPLVEEITIHDSFYEWKPSANGAVKARGLAKLTEEEKLALGLQNS
jgi:hypothetical protein